MPVKSRDASCDVFFTLACLNTAAVGMVPQPHRGCKLGRPPVAPRPMHGPCRHTRFVLLLLSLLWLPSSSHAASLQPLTVQEVRTLPNGKAEASLSLSYFDAL